MNAARRHQSTGPDPDETRDIRELIAEVVPHSESWIHTPHELLGGQSPADLFGTEQEERVRELTRAIKHGVFS
jgi:hypothetical protein